MTLTAIPYGLASGLICSFAFPMEALLPAMALGFVLRGNLVAAALASFFINPISSPLVDALAQQLGVSILGTGLIASLADPDRQLVVFGLTDMFLAWLGASGPARVVGMAAIAASSVFMLLAIGRKLTGRHSEPAPIKPA